MKKTRSDNPCRVEPYFSGLPVMCSITEVEGRENQFLVFPAVESIEEIKKLLSFICEMKTEVIIEEFSYATILEDFFHW